MISFYKSIKILSLLAVILFILPAIANASEIQIRISVENAFFFSSPDEGSDVIGKATFGQIYMAQEKMGQWYKVKILSEEGTLKTGYIYERLVEVIGIEPGPQKIAPDKRGRTFSFFLNGGLGFVDSGDFNTIVRGESEQWADSGEYFDWSEWKNMPEIHGSIIINITRNLGLGFGAGYMTKKSHGEYGEVDFEYKRDYTFRFIPVSGSIYLTIPTGIVNFFIIGGADYYFGKIQQQNIFYGWGSEHSTEENVSCNVLGYHVGAGIEFDLSSSTSFIISGIYRIANFKNWTGTYHVSDEFMDYTQDGELYYYENHQSWDGEWHWIPRLSVWQLSGLPSNRRNTRMGEINIGGFAITAGIKIRL